MQRNILKMSSLFYAFATSATFDLLGKDRVIEDIAQKLNYFFYDNALEVSTSARSFGKPVSDENISKILDPIHSEIFKKIQDIILSKYKKIVAPYIKEGINLSNFENNQNVTALQLDQGNYASKVHLLMHDLIHETISPGSNSLFKERDLKIKNQSKLILEDDEEYEDDPPYSFDLSVYDLGHYIEEDVVGSLTEKKTKVDNGLFPYLFLIMVATSNDVFGTNITRSGNGSHGFGTYVPLSLIDTFFQRIVEKIQNDIKELSNPSYKKIATSFLHSLVGWIREIKQRISNYYKNVDTDEIKLLIIVNKILFNLKEWTSSKFNAENKRELLEHKRHYSYQNPLMDYRDPSLFKERSVENLTNDFKMSLLRRWLSSVKVAVEKLIDGVRSSKEFKDKIDNVVMQLRAQQ